jgi:non-heme chloroperoxidase
MPVIGTGDDAIYFEATEGVGPLVLHTGAGGDLRMWTAAGYPPRLSGRRLILIDHRGHGRSGRPVGVEQHRIDRYVDDVLRVADELELDQFAFFGYSDGAWVGYRLASRDQSRITAVIGLGAVGEEDEPQDGRLELAHRVRADGMAAMVAALRADEPDITGWFIDQMRSSDPEMVALELEGWLSWVDPWSDLLQLTVPTLLIVGGLEEGPTGVAEEHARRLLPRSSGSRVVVLPDVGHAMAFVRSELVAAAVQDFLDDIAGLGPRADMKVGRAGGYTPAS